MVQQRYVAGGALVLGLLVLAMAGRTDEAVTVKAVESLGGKVTVDAKRTGKPVAAVDLSLTQVTDACLEPPALALLLFSCNSARPVCSHSGIKGTFILQPLQILCLR